VIFEEFAAARLPAVLKFAAVLTGDRGLAEDVVQEVLIRANARWQVIENLPRPEAYVRKMIVNEYLTWRRRSWRLAYLRRILYNLAADGWRRRGAWHRRCTLLPSLLHSAALLLIGPVLIIASVIRKPPQ
jgi:DNA-directed RNA polymerase specialized sigma24 family protein